jgi:hypothetical protein
MEDTTGKQSIQGIDNRIDVIMTMDIRKSKRDELTEEEEWELQQFEEQYRNRAR